MFQASMRTPEELAKLQNKHGYLVVKLKVSELQDIGLSVVPTDEPGHVSIPELKYTSYKTDPRTVEVLKNKLAKLASTRIVYRTDLPVD